MDASVALVHEWLVGWGGSERVLQEMAALFPDAPIYTAVWSPDARVEAAFGGRDVRPTFLDRIPGSASRYPWLLPLMPAAYRALDLREYDLVLSSSHAFSKAVKTRDDALHLCYCHTPPRYLWDQAAAYHRGRTGALRRPLLPLVLPLLRRADRRAARGVDAFAANSRHVAGRIRRSYGREATVVHPPVDVERFAAAEGTAGSEPDAAPAARSRGAEPRTAEPQNTPAGSYYLAGGRLVAYKEVEAAVAAANAEGLALKVFGDGPERRRIEDVAGPTVEVLGPVSDDELVELAAGCRAYLFPGVEDFGILPVEVQAAGRPVVARADGGALETVVDGRTGVLYDYRGAGHRDLLAGIRRLDELLAAGAVGPEACRVHARRFGPDAFREAYLRFVERDGMEDRP